MIGVIGVIGVGYRCTVQVRLAVRLPALVRRQQPPLRSTLCAFRTRRDSIAAFFHGSSSPPPLLPSSPPVSSLPIYPHHHHHHSHSHPHCPSSASAGPSPPPRRNPSGPACCSVVLVAVQRRCRHLLERRCWSMPEARLLLLGCAIPLSLERSCHSPGRLARCWM